MRALDLFAGAGGWSLACEQLGIDEYGVEIMPEAIASREAAGMTTLYHDAWDFREAWKCVPLGRTLDLLIASPPCQTFSVAGKGAGREALVHVLQEVTTGGYKSKTALREAGERWGDERTALVLLPLFYWNRMRPRYVVLEQVPTVLPVWEAYAEVMEREGYSVWTGVLNAEQYGVPQTRRRAILIARADGIEAAPPAPTHSRYYSRSPQNLDPGVQRWITMAEALGWQESDRVLRSNYGTSGDPVKRGERTADQPAPTVTSKAGRNVWFTRPATTIVADPRLAGPGRSEFVKGGVPRRNRPGSMNLTIDEAAALQSYPAGFQFAGNKGKQFLQVGNAVPPRLAAAILRTLVPTR